MLPTCPQYQLMCGRGQPHSLSMRMYCLCVFVCLVNTRHFCLCLCTSHAIAVGISTACAAAHSHACSGVQICPGGRCLRAGLHHHFGLSVEGICPTFVSFMGTEIYLFLAGNGLRTGVHCVESLRNSHSIFHPTAGTGKGIYCLFAPSHTSSCNIPMCIHEHFDIYSVV